MNILLIDDDEAFHHFFQLAGKMAGPEVRAYCATSLKQGRQLAKSVNMSVIILDDRLGGGESGSQAYTEFAKYAPIGKTYLTSAAYHPSHATEHVLPKPISLEQLKKIILKK